MEFVQVLTCSDFYVCVISIYYVVALPHSKARVNSVGRIELCW